MKYLSCSFNSLTHRIDCIFGQIFHLLKTSLNHFSTPNSFLNDRISKLVQLQSSIFVGILSLFVNLGCEFTKGNEMIIKLGYLFYTVFSKPSNIINCTICPLSNITKHVLKVLHDLFTKISHSIKDVTRRFTDVFSCLNSPISYG